MDSLSNFKCLSVNDLSIEHFLSAKEDNDDASNSGLNFRYETKGGQPLKNTAKYPHIISSALVDSDNEESFDDINDELGHTRRAEFVVGDSDEPSRVEQVKAVASDGSDRASKSRLMWQRHSLLHRSYALQANGNDDDASHCDRDKLARASTSGNCNIAGIDGNNNKNGNRSNYAEEEVSSRDGVQAISSEQQQQQQQQESSEHKQLSQVTSHQKVLIRINDTSRPDEYSYARQEESLIATADESPPPPPSSPAISDTPIEADFEVRRKSTNHHHSRGQHLRPIDASQATGSLSDNSHQRSSEKMALLERRQMEERLRNWKRSNKIITHIRENPFNLHMECLERIEQLNLDGQLKIETEETYCNKTTDDNKSSKQQEQLQSYATHLSHLYKKNQTLMDNNSDFRNLLYNIICCLLIQEEQVLTSASVTKMIDVIRTHLESASKYYSTAIMQLSVQTNATSNANVSESRRKSSLGSITSCSTSSNTSSAYHQTKSNEPQQQVERNTLHPIDAMFCDQSHENRSQKPVDFRRISSVSYNDEQLINDLCDGQSEQTGASSSGGDRNSACESPWRYEELSSECKHQIKQQYNSQSSLENQAATMVEYFLQHDSGVGTATCQENYGGKRLLKQQLSNQDSRRSSWINRRKLSYLSSEDCFTHLQTADDDSNGPSFLGRQDDLQQKPIDVAGLKSELEWTLNKLINFELKYTWLTSKDTLRRAIRKIGVPNEIRGKVWLILIDQLVGTRYDVIKLLEEASKTISLDEELHQANSQDSLLLNSITSPLQDGETHAILKQIDLDVNRTMPGHKLFDDGAEGGVKLRRILVAYSIHVNKEIAYCQGFNFIVALLLSVFEGDEERALRGFICIVDHIFPSKFYFDHYLTGARADQFLLADFICDQLIKNPSTTERKMVEGVTSSITLNWFISLFHGAVPTLTRLTILDHFMLEGVKALFRFTMAILYLAFQVTPPSSCEVFNTIRTTARDMYDIKLLLSIVEQIKLPKDSYFAIRRSFYMLQSSFNSDQFYMQSLSSEANKHCVANKPLSVQQMPETKPPALSLISGSSLVSAMSDNSHFRQQLSNNSSSAHNGGPGGGPRIRTSSNRSKVCMQNIGKLGRSHLKIMDANDRSNERSLMSPLRNCLVIGISNCGKSIIVARQSSRKNFKIFKEQDLTFYIHELSTEIFDGFYLEDLRMALILTNMGEIFKIDTSKCFTDNQTGSAETLMLRSSISSSSAASSSASSAMNDNERLKLRLASLDPLTKLLWIYAECECDTSDPPSPRLSVVSEKKRLEEQLGDPVAARRRAMKSNNPFMFDSEDYDQQQQQQQQSTQRQRKIFIIDVMTFDMFSAFTIHQGFGDIIKLRTSLVAFCQLANPMSNQFSSRIVRIGPTGRYEHLLSFSDVVDFMINLSDSHKHQQQQQQNSSYTLTRQSQRYSSIRKLFNRSTSLNCNAGVGEPAAPSAGTLTRYYRSLIRSHSNAGCEQMASSGEPDPTTDQSEPQTEEPKCKLNHTKTFMDHSSCRSILNSCVSAVENNTLVGDYLPVNMTFIFRNGKIALFEFTKSYAIHTRESQLDRYDYSRVIDVTKSSEDFIVTILTVLGRLIKVVI